MGTPDLREILGRCQDRTKYPRGMLQCTLPSGHEADPLSLHTIDFDDTGEQLQDVVSPAEPSED